MRILIVTGIFPPDPGGPATYVPAIAHALSGCHDIVGIVTLSDRTDHSDPDHAFKIFRVQRAQPKPVRLLQVVGLIRRLARDADLVYLNGLVLEGIVACKLLRRRPVVVKVVGDLIWERARNQGATDLLLDDFNRAPLPFKWRLLRALQAWYMRRADRIITPSRYLAGVVAGWGVSRDRIDVVYNATKTGKPKPTPIAPDHDIVAVMRLVPWKGVDQLIEVALQHGWRLLVVGDGPCRPALEAQSQAVPGGAALITFRGHVSKEAVIDEIQRARVFVLNSSYEGLPHVVLEAKAAGVPVVATAAGGTPEVVTDDVDGLIVPLQPDRRQALASRIERLLIDEGLHQRLAAAARTGLGTRFAFSTMVDETARVLQLAVDGR